MIHLVVFRPAIDTNPSDVHNKIKDELILLKFNTFRKDHKKGCNSSDIIGLTVYWYSSKIWFYCSQTLPPMNYREVGSKGKGSRTSLMTLMLQLSLGGGIHLLDSTRIRILAREKVALLRTIFISY